MRCFRLRWREVHAGPGGGDRHQGRVGRAAAGDPGADAVRQGRLQGPRRDRQEDQR